jgi:hypothetical protein
MTSTTNWEIQSLRVALFPQRAVPLSLDIFTALIGTPPELQEDRPREGARRQAGTLDDGNQLQIVITPIRIDLAKTVAQNPAELLGGMQMTMGPFQGQADPFIQLVRSWLPETNDLSILRLALTGTALAEASSATGAYEILQNNVQSVNIRPGEMRDLMYRVNWRASTEQLPGDYLNHLTTWSAVMFRISAGVLTGPGVSLAERHFAQMEFDVNTPAERSEPLPSTQLTPIFDDMVELVSRNVQAGECAP